MEFDNDMQVIITKVVSDNPNAPPLRVRVTMNGQDYTTGVWVWEKKDENSPTGRSPVLDKNGNKMFKGKLEVDDYQPPGNQRPAPKQEVSLDDDIPF